VHAGTAGLAGLGALAAGARSLYGAAVGKSGTLALKGGTPVRSRPFSSTWPILDESEEKALLQALRAENIPMRGGPRRYSGGCHKEKMLQKHLNSAAFRASFSPARLQEYRDSLRFPVMDGERLSPKEMLSMDSKIPFLGTRQEMDEIVEAVQKVARNIASLA